MTIGDRIRKKREDVGISQTDLANAIDVSKQTLYKYENNIITNIPSDKIEKISKILDISPVYIMGWDESYYLGENLQNIFEILSSEFSVPTNELIRCFFSNNFTDLLPSKKIISLDNMRDALQKHFAVLADRNNITSTERQDHLKKYCELDPHGKEIVDFILQKEWERSTTALEPGGKKETTAEIIPMRFLSYYQRMASAGSGEFLFSDIPTDVIAVPDTPLSRKADFVIGVSGRSMEDTYFDGDKVLVEKTQDVPIGKVGIFIRGTECFIKEVGENRLISHNENKEQYPDIIPDERGIDTIGVVLGKVGD